MKQFTITWLDAKTVAIAGVVDEYADFTELNLAASTLLTVDFSGVVRMNSSGIRTWVQTIMKNQIQLNLRNCASAVVEQFSMIPEFIGRNGQVESFFVPYHCQSCDYETKRLMRPGLDIPVGVSIDFPTSLAQACPKCGGKVEFDHNPEIYFSFLRYIKSQKAS